VPGVKLTPHTIERLSEVADLTRFFMLLAPSPKSKKDLNGRIGLFLPSS